MADSVDRVFGHALNTINKIRPGSHKPPPADRLALYGLYKQSMEGDVAAIAEPPTPESLPDLSTDALKKEQEKWEAWKSNEGLSRTEAKRRYIEKLINTMHEYASGTDEARELVEELEFVWEQVKSNSQHSSSERSSPLRNLDQSGYIQSSSSGNGHGGITESTAAMDRSGAGMGREERGTARLRVLSPVSQVEEEAEALGEEEEEREIFVDAPLSQIDVADSDPSVAGDDGAADSRHVSISHRAVPGQAQWRKRVESSLIRLTTEVAALREQLESRRFLSQQRKHSLLGWLWRLGWWGAQVFIADAVVLWCVILYMRRKKDRRLEGAVRVLLGDAVAQVQKVGREVKIPALPKLGGRKGG